MTYILICATLYAFVRRHFITFRNSNLGGILPATLLTTLFLFGKLSASAGSTTDQERWWPVQKAPKGILRTDYSLMKEVQEKSGKPVHISFGPEHMMVESVAGLAAQAVNEGRCDELVWIDGPNENYAVWFKGMTNRLHLVDRGTFTPWNLVKRFAQKKIVKGYILYSYDQSEGGLTRIRENSDESANVATSLAGVLQGIIVSEGQEKEAIAAGLKMLADVRGKTEAWCFENYRERMNRSYVLVQDPMAPHCRDIAIAHKMLAIYGHDAPTTNLYAWLNPLSSVIGWNGGDEGKSVVQMSRAGHTLLPCNWSMNLCALSAGSDSHDVSKLPSPSSGPAADASDDSHAVSFIMSDGDNVQWLMGAFCLDKRYWSSPDHGKFPVGWGAPLGCLAQACPDVLAFLKETQRADSTLSLHGGGYFYPDIFGADRGPETRKHILRQHARKISHFMELTDCRTLMFLTKDLASPGALEAYQIFAEEIEPLIGMFVIQYHPYEGGDGRTFWVKSRKGDEIPVVTCKYSIWANMPADKERAGTPAKIAHAINAAARKAEANGGKLNAWAITHTWSAFKQIQNNDEMAENAAEGTVGSYAITPTYWCVQRLEPDIKVVTPEELIWRIRRSHSPDREKQRLGN